MILTLWRKDPCCGAEQQNDGKADDGCPSSMVSVVYCDCAEAHAYPFAMVHYLRLLDGLESNEDSRATNARAKVVSVSGVDAQRDVWSVLKLRDGRRDDAGSTFTFMVCLGITLCLDETSVIYRV